MKETLFASMFQVMVEKGLVDEAAGAIHQAGLGNVLKRLAGVVKGEEAIIAKRSTPTVKMEVER